MITKEDFQEWKQNEVTVAMLTEFNMQTEELKEQLAVDAGHDSQYDGYRVALISCLRDVLDWCPENLEAELKGEK